LLPLFPKWTNNLARLSLALLALIPAVALGFSWVWVRSPLRTGQNQPIAQPVQFDHRHHVVDVGIDCRYCHQTVETSSSAGVPPAELCMNCHSQIWNKSPKLEPVRQAFFSGQPIPWHRVNKLPDFVYFNHSIHLAKGVGCVTCHGRIDEMAEVAQGEPLTMEFCLNCHRNPEPQLRPKEYLTDMAWKPVEDPTVLGARLAEENHVHSRTSCTTCHR
jgi:hypothetical protein